MKFHVDDIFTPQGLLKEVEKNPNLDFLMNIFNIPRAFGVSGFGGGWSVGQHSFATALIAMYWSRYNKFGEAKRDRLVTLAVVHDLHESVTGDILPMFKSKELRSQLDKIQSNIMSSLSLSQDRDLTVDLKIVDMIAFLYEIKQVSPNILHPKKLRLANTIAKKQLDLLLEYCRENSIKKVRIEKFLQTIEITT